MQTLWSVFPGPFLRLFVAGSLSGVGDSFRYLALALVVLGVAGAKGPALALLTLVQTLPAFAVGLFAGALVDRWPKRTVMLVSDAGRALLSGAMALAALHHALGLLWLCLACSGALAVFGDLAANVSVPRLAGNAALERANALLGVGHQLTLVIGPALAALCFARFGGAVSLLIDALSFCISFALLLGLPPEPTPDLELARRHSNFWRDLWADVLTGWRCVWTSRALAGLCGIGLLQAAAAGINNTIMLLFITQDLRLPATSVALLSASNGVAQLLTGGALVAWGHRAPMRRVLLTGLGTMLLGAVLVASASALWLLVLGVVVTALGNAPVNVASTTLTQRLVPSSLLARVEGALSVALILLFLTGSSGAGFTVGTLDARGLLVSSGVLSLAAFGLAWGLRRTWTETRPEA